MTQLPSEFDGLVDNGYLEVTDKLRECAYFHDLMTRTTDWNQFRWLTSAFLNAARATIDWLALSAYYAIPGDAQYEMGPDEGAIATLSGYLVMKQEKKTGKVYASPLDPLLKELCDHRTVTAHEGPLWITPERVVDAQEFRFALGDKPVLPFARDVLGLLARIQHELRPDLR